MLGDDEFMNLLALLDQTIAQEGIPKECANWRIKRRPQRHCEDWTVMHVVYPKLTSFFKPVHNWLRQVLNVNDLCPMELLYLKIGETAKSPEKPILIPSCFAIEIFKDNISLPKLKNVLNFASISDNDILNEVLYNDSSYERIQKGESVILNQIAIVIDGKKKLYVKEQLEENKELAPLLEIAREQELKNEQEKAARIVRKQELIYGREQELKAMSEPWMGDALLNVNLSSGRDFDCDKMEAVNPFNVRKQAQQNVEVYFDDQVDYFNSAPPKPKSLLQMATDLWEKSPDKQRQNIQF